MLTPFTGDGNVDYDAHCSNLERWNGEDLAGVLVLGSNSETPFLTDEEKLQLIELTVRHAAPGRTVIAGTGCESTRRTIWLTEKAASLGVGAVLVLTPFYYGQRMTDTALIRHYLSVADASPVPVMIYNVPAYTHLNVPIGVIRRLAEHPNISGMKESSTDIGRFSQILNAVPPSFTLLTGSAAVWYPALALGVDGGILALANCAGTACSRVRTLFREGNVEEARRLYLRLLPVNTAITLTYGVPGLKAAAAMLGYKGCFVRSPLQPCSQEETEEIRRLLTAAGINPRAGS